VELIGVEVEEEVAERLPVWLEEEGEVTKRLSGCGEERRKLWFRVVQSK
jgi:hypothetical protein